MGGRVDIEADDVAQLVDKLRVGGELELFHPMRLQAVRPPDALDGTCADIDDLCHPGGGPVSRFCWRGGLGERHDAFGDVRPQRRDARTSRLVSQETVKRSCQRQTQVFDLPVRRMISLVPTPSALNSTISARQTCLCGALRSRVSTFRRRRSAGLRVMEIPVRMRQTRMRPIPWESPPGFKCQTRSTSSYLAPSLWRRQQQR
jgi:hypothetical protein